MQFEKNTCVFLKKKTCFFHEKNLASKKKHSKSFFFNTHLKEITS